MGNYRFKISDMIPNAWLHKLKGKTPSHTRNKTMKKQPVTTSSSPQSAAPTPHPTKPHHRKSYYFTRDLTLPDPTLHTNSPPPPDPPRSSSKKKRPTTAKPSSIPRDPITCTCQSTDPYPDNMSLGISGSGSTNSMVSLKTSPDEKFENIDLAPITTKPEKFGSGRWVIEGRNRSISLSTKEQHSPVRKLPGKLKANNYSPRVGGRVRVQAINGGRRSTGNRRSLSESFAVMKASVDPQRDFKESMVEMIMENNIKSSKDLEELLACYLSLNSDEYHDLIIKVFKQIWFESTGIRF